jgi:hypothetical protein
VYKDGESDQQDGRSYGVELEDGAVATSSYQVSIDRVRGPVCHSEYNN